MKRIPMTLMTASLLALLAGSANAQEQQDHSPRQAVGLAERMTETHASLAGAIAAAEKYSNGTAIRARVTGSQSMIRQAEPRGKPGLRGSKLSEQTTAPLAKDAQNGQSNGQGSTQTGRNPETLYAVVTCVMGNTMVRDVVVDLKENTVLGMQAVAATRGNSDSWGDRYDSNAELTRGHLVRASDLMNADVRNAQGNRVGDINDLAIDPENHRVVYGVLGRGGVLGFGESRYAIPVSELDGLQNGILMLNLDDADFKGDDGFDKDRWPKRADAEWDTSWNTEPVTVQDAKRIAKASDIIGSTAESRDGKKLGKITDLVLNPRTGAVEYAVIKAERGSMPVPMSAMQMKGDTCVVQHNAADLLNKPVLDPEREPSWNDARWNRILKESYGIRVGQRAEPNANTAP